nr:immunoglobulin light chain junction region [Macaca mulatta]
CSAWDSSLNTLV